MGVLRSIHSKRTDYLPPVLPVPHPVCPVVPPVRPLSLAHRLASCNRDLVDVAILAALNPNSWPAGVPGFHWQPGIEKWGVVEDHNGADSYTPTLPD